MMQSDTNVGTGTLATRLASSGWQRPRQLAAALHARDDQMEQTESELRILEVELLELIVVDHRGLHVALAAHRHGAPAVRREQADLAEQRTVAECLTDLHDLDLA